MMMNEAAGWFEARVGFRQIVTRENEIIGGFPLSPPSEHGPGLLSVPDLPRRPSGRS